MILAITYVSLANVAISILMVFLAHKVPARHYLVRSSFILRLAVIVLTAGVLFVVMISHIASIMSAL